MSYLKRYRNLCLDFAGDMPSPEKLLRDADATETELRERLAAAERRLAETEKALGEEIDNRDRAAEWADKIANAIGDCGEHSNENNPWRNAVERADELTERLTRAEADGAAMRRLLEEAWAAIGDGQESKRLGGKGITVDYARAVMTSIRAALASDHPGADLLAVVEAVRQCREDQGGGYDVLASASWDKVLAALATYDARVQEKP